MAKRRSLTETVEPYINALQIAAKQEKIARVKRAASAIRKIIGDLRGIATITDSILLDAKINPNAKTGRHAKPERRVQQLHFDMECYTTVEALRAKGLTWLECYLEAADSIPVNSYGIKKKSTEDTVRKAYFRMKRLLREIAAHESTTLRQKLGRN